ncbi:MAG: hypothetical protein RXR20_08900 [Paraburkholderia sp.]|jgi:hypothetical protein|uniref:hypothetical protein n=1 Tax=Burkholderiaceae TaxID=119060 RepID=UPI0010F5D423|nr:hypothetical protein [Burkholderia sp. 4M9327F10]
MLITPSLSIPSKSNPGAAAPANAYMVERTFRATINEGNHSKLLIEKCIPKLPLTSDINVLLDGDIFNAASGTQ